MVRNCRILARLAAALAAVDEEERFIGAHSADGSGCVERTQYRAAASQNKLGGLYEAASIVRPPTPHNGGVRLRNAVCHGEVDARFALHRYGVVERVHACGDYAASQIRELGAVGFPFG